MEEHDQVERIKTFAFRETNDDEPYKSIRGSHFYLNVGISLCFDIKLSIRVSIYTIFNTNEFNFVYSQITNIFRV